LKLCVLTADEAKQFWPLVEKPLRAAMQRSGAAFAPIESDVFAGRALLWLATDIVIEAAAVTYVIETEWRRYCEIAVCAGRKRKNWLHLIAGIEQYAHCAGCEVTRIVGREGWKRALPSYRQIKIVLEKRLG
jgi:hypothetical protein